MIKNERKGGKQKANANFPFPEHRQVNSMYITYCLIKDMATMSQTADSRVRMHKDDYQLLVRQKNSTHKIRYQISLGKKKKKEKKK